MFYGQQQLCEFLRCFFPLFLFIFLFISVLFFHFVYAVKKLRDASASSCLFMICSCCHMQSFTDATPTRLLPIAWNCLLLLLLLLRILVCWFFICMRLLYFFGIALGMFDMISGIALVNLTKEKKNGKVVGAAAAEFCLYRVKATCRLLAPPPPFAPREQCQSQTSERSINFWQTTRKWNRKRKQNNAKKRKKKKEEKITAQSGETRVSEIDGIDERGWGKRGLAQTLQLWLSWKSSVSGHGKHITLCDSLPFLRSPHISPSFGGFYFI